MFADTRYEKLAKVMVNYSVNVKEGDLCQIKGSSLATPLIQVLYKEILKAGGYPVTNVRLPGIHEIFLKTASKKQLSRMSEIEYYIIDNITKSFTILGSENSKELTTCDPSSLAMYKKGADSIIRRYNERWQNGELKFVVTSFPTHSSAQDSEMSLDEFSDVFFGSCFLDKDDPVAEFKKLSKKQAKLVDFLKDKKNVHIKAPNTDLKLSIEGGTFVNSDGKYNLPDGEVFTCPKEGSANGHINFSYPLCYGGREVSDVHLEIKDGRIIEAKAFKGEEYLLKMLNIDDGARNIGEFAFGMNEKINKFTKDALFDEKMGGTIHIAAGYGIPESGGKINSSLHWDMICDLRKDGEVWVDGYLLVKNGKYCIDLE
ncbi:MAG: aminopeptidase [Pseudomonadota bacterium]